MPASPRPCRRPNRRVPVAAAAALLLLAALAAVPAAAQSTQGPPVDLRFTVRDATTGQPAVGERLTVAYIAGRLNTVLDTTPGGAAFTAPGVPVKDIGQYVITLWYQGVPYWWQKRGSDLIAGPVDLDVFSVTENRDAVRVTGLNLVVRHVETVAELELMVEVANDARPQAVVSRGTGTFTLALPAGAASVEATYQRGPEPTPVPVTVSGTTAAVAMPLTPGANRLRLVARAPWDDQLELPVGSDLPIDAWSLLCAPTSVTVEATDLQAPDETSVPGFVRRAGAALAAGQTVTLRLHASVPAGRPEDLFAKPAADTAAAAATPGREAAPRRGLVLPLALLGALVIIGGLAVARRGRS